MAKVEKIKGAKKLAAKEVIPFTRQISSMFGAGMSILTALKVVAGSLGNRVYEKSILAARTEVEQGN